MSHRYYSPLRPLSLGTFPKPQGNEILHIENFEERQNVPEIARQAWGYSKLSVYCWRRSHSKGRHGRTAVCGSNTEAVRNAGEVGEADSDSKGIYRHAGKFRPPAHYRGRGRRLRRVSGAFKPFADHEISEEYRKYSEHEVKKFRAVPEITHRRWEELGLMKPLEPEQTAQYKFSDLQMSLYYTIYI